VRQAAALTGLMPGSSPSWLSMSRSLRVAACPVILPPADPVNVDLVGFEGPSGGRHGVQDAAGPDPWRELPQVRAPCHHPVHHRVAAGDFLLDLEMQVGERGAPRRDDMPQRGVAARPAGCRSW
jgi:hypothetical protein